MASANSLSSASSGLTRGFPSVPRPRSDHFWFEGAAYDKIPVHRIGVEDDLPADVEAAVVAVLRGGVEAILVVHPSAELALRDLETVFAIAAGQVRLQRSFGAIPFMRGGRARDEHQQGAGPGNTSSHLAAPLKTVSPLLHDNHQPRDGGH